MERADQALYLAKAQGRARVASFVHVARASETVIA